MSKKLSNPETAPKTYWKILNHFLRNKKKPSIPPLSVNRKMKFFKKGELFNTLFASQCMPLCMPLRKDDILPIIKSLNSNKAHGWDKLSIKMIKMCHQTLVYPLKLIFKASIQEGVFRIVGKKLMLYLFTKRK